MNILFFSLNKYLLKIYFDISYLIFYQKFSGSWFEQKQKKNQIRFKFVHKYIYKIKQNHYFTYSLNKPVFIFNLIA